MAVELNTAAAVMDAIGGTQAVADLTGSGYKAAHNWRAFGAFPPRTYVVITEALEARGYAAPASLWRMIGPDVSRETERTSA